MGQTTTDIRRKRHSVDLAGHIQACEINYHRLIGLLPGLRDGCDYWTYEAGNTANIKILIQLKESAPYTSVVKITQVQSGTDLPYLVLRLCHDADVAEVIEWEGHKYWESEYQYPNPKMYQPDEKQALNRFLGDWLVFCRNHGIVPPGICESVLVNGK